MWAPFGPIWGPFLFCLGPIWAHLDPFWAHGLFWPYFGLFWPYFGLSRASMQAGPSDAILRYSELHSTRLDCTTLQLAKP